MAQLKVTLDDALLDQLRALAYLTSQSITMHVSAAVGGYLAGHEAQVDVATLLRLRAEPASEDAR